MDIEPSVGSEIQLNPEAAGQDWLSSRYGAVSESIVRNFTPESASAPDFENKALGALGKFFEPLQEIKDLKSFFLFVVLMGLAASSFVVLAVSNSKELKDANQ